MKRHFNAKFNIETEKKICELYKKGVRYSSTFLAKKFKCSYGAIINLLRKHGIKIRSNSESQKNLRLDKKHHSYKGGNISPEGYKRIYISNEKGDRVLKLEHVYFMEKKIGRKISLNEVVHHKNRIKHDNRLCNLQLMTRAEHINFHRNDLC